MIILGGLFALGWIIAGTYFVWKNWKRIPAFLIILAIVCWPATLVILGVSSASKKNEAA